MRREVNSGAATSSVPLAPEVEPHRLLRSLRLGTTLHIVPDPGCNQMRVSYVRQQKTNKRDAGYIPRQLVELRFPCIWVCHRLQTVIDASCCCTGTS